MQLGVALFGLGLEFGGDLAVFDDLAVVTPEVDCAHFHQIDDSLEVGLEPDGKLEHHRIVTELVAQGAGDAMGVGAGTIALVDEGDARHLVALHLPVHGDGLGLHAGHGAEDEHGAVEDLERTLDLDGEVDVPRGVDDVDVVVFPLDVGGGRRDRNAALPFQIHVIHGGADAILALDVVDGVDPLGVEQDPLGERGLARVDVGRDPDVPDL